MQQLERDALTGAYGRAAFQPLLEHYQSAFTSAQQAYSIVVIDLDHFKSVNDAFGHQRGDEVLIALADRIQSQLDEHDRLIRFGGDEFVVLLAEDKTEAVSKAQLILEVVRGEAIAGDPPLHLSLSMGLATIKYDGDEVEKLFQVADERALISKRQGRGRLTYENLELSLDFDEEGRLLARDVALEQGAEIIGQVINGGAHLLNLKAKQGVGRTRFLQALKRLAQLQGLLCLEITGQEALQTRLNGALLTSKFRNSPTSFASPDAFYAALDKQSQNASGILILVDDGQFLDDSSLSILQKLLQERDGIGLVSVGKNLTVSRAKTVSLSLEPFDLDVVKLWLRSALHSDPSEAFSTWFYEQSEGYPALMRHGLELLVARDIVKRAEGQWQYGNYHDLDLKTLIQESRRPPPVQLPIWASPFLGRQGDLEQVKQLLEQGRLVSILGPGGIGKSRLASQVGQEVRHRFQAGVYFIGLADIHEARAFYSHIAKVLGLPLTGVNDIENHVLEAFEDSPCLLILDNLEHLLDLIPKIQRLLSRCPQVSLLVTSQEALRLEQEHCFYLRGLEMPQDADDEALEHYDAIQLFTKQARGGRNFNLEQQGKEHVVRICQLTEGVPLLLELAAAWTAIFSCRHIADELEKSVGFLEQAPGQQGRIWRMLDYFWSLLSLHERRVLAKMTIFQGGFRAEAAQNVADASLFFLLALLDRSLVIQEGERFSIHPLLKQYARQSVQINLPALKARHARYFAALTEGFIASQQDGDNATTYAIIDEELANLNMVWSWFCDKQDIQSIYPLANVLRGYHDVRGLTQAGLDLYEQAIQQLEPVAHTNPHTYGWLLEAKSLFLMHFGRLHEAENIAQQSLSILEPEGASEALAMVSNTLGMLAFRRGDLSDSRVYIEQTIAIQEHCGNTRGMIRALGNLAFVIEDLGDKTAAKAVYHRAIRLSEAEGMHGSQAISLHNLGQMHIKDADIEGGTAFFEQGLNLVEKIHYPRLEAHLLLALGQVRNWYKNHSEALEMLHRAEQLFKELHDIDSQVKAGLARAKAYLGLGKEEDVLACLYVNLDLIDIHQLQNLTNSVALVTAELRLYQQRHQEAVLLCGYLEQGREQLPELMQLEVEQLSKDLANIVSAEIVKGIQKKSASLEQHNIMDMARGATTVMV